jgi:CHASE2 domain-containing sensor protein
MRLPLIAFRDLPGLRLDQIGGGLNRKYTKKHSRDILRDFLRFALIAILMSLFGQVIAESSFGRQVRIGTYELMQRHLLDFKAPAKLSVVVVGIDGIPPVVIDDGLSASKQVTPRDKILDLLRRLVVHRPKAIGVDVDFSPESDGGSFVTAGDPKFFDNVMRLSAESRIPIFLGVDRHRNGPPSAWLGELRFAPLAAAIVVPYAEEGVTIRSMPLRLLTAATGALPSLSGAMVGEAPAEVGSWRRWFFARYRSVSQSREPPSAADKDSRADHFLVDFAAVPELTATKIPSSGITTDDDQTSQLEGRFVLLGDSEASHSGDRFLLPGYDRPVKGVFAHASAIYTLTQAPLFELTPQGELIVDGSLALLSFLIVEGLTVYFSGRGRQQLAVERIQLVLTLIVVVSLILIGHYAVHTLRLVWMGYALVILMQLLHLTLEHAMHGHHTAHPGKKRPAWRRWLFETPRGD